MCSTKNRLLITILAVTLAFASSQTSTDTPYKLKHFTCFTDICNVHGQDQFCSERESKCRNCEDIVDNCFDQGLPRNCSRWCIEIGCQVYGSIRNGRHNGSLTQSQALGDVIEITCNPGYYISGAKILECKEYGQWSQEFPTCEEIKCPVLPFVFNGRHNGSTTIANALGNVVSVVCSHGYHSIGPDSTTCNDKGEWGSQLPVCQKIQCPLLHEIKNGNHNGSLHTHHVPGDLIVSDCKDSHLLLGTDSTVCNAQGVWTYPLPMCQVIECNEPPQIQNGKWSDVFQTETGRFDVLHIIQASCNNGYTLKGPDKRECSKIGSWYSRGGLNMPFCIKGDTDEWKIVAIVAPVAGFILRIFICILLYCLYCKRRNKQKYQAVEKAWTTKDKGNEYETAVMIEPKIEENNAERMPLQANPSPPRPISLHSQKLQREAQSDASRLRAVPPNIPTPSPVFNASLTESAEVANSPRNSEGSPNIPSPNSVFDGSQRERSEHADRPGMSGPNGHSDDPPSVPSWSSTSDANPGERLECLNNPGNRLTLNINVNANSTNDNTNCLVLGSGVDSRYPKESDMESATPPTPRSTPKEMDDLKVEEEKTPIEESGTFQPSQPQTPGNTEVKMALRSYDTDPLESFDTCRDEQLGDNCGPVNGLAIQQSANNEQDTARKLAMPNGDLNTDDINVSV